MQRCILRACEQSSGSTSIGTSWSSPPLQGKSRQNHGGTESFRRCRPATLNPNRTDAVVAFRQGFMILSSHDSVGWLSARSVTTDFRLIVMRACGIHAPRNPGNRWPPAPSPFASPVRSCTAARDSCCRNRALDAVFAVLRNRGRAVRPSRQFAAGLQAPETRGKFLPGEK